MITVKCQKSFDTIEDLGYVWLSLLNDINSVKMRCFGKDIEYLKKAFNKAGFEIEYKNG
jgi:hypothetical protein